MHKVYRKFSSFSYETELLITTDVSGTPRPFSASLFIVFLTQLTNHGSEVKSSSN